jgi:hypothetical protein
MLVFACSAAWQGFKPTGHLLMIETADSSIGDMIVVRKFPKGCGAEESAEDCTGRAPDAQRIVGSVVRKGGVVHEDTYRRLLRANAAVHCCIRRVSLDTIQSASA